MKSFLKEGEDYYREGNRVVFTEKYLKSRGYCCNGNCRHCPYEKSTKGSPDSTDK